MKPSLRIMRLIYLRGYPKYNFEQHIEHKTTAIIDYLDEQYAITNSTTTMKKTKKVNKLKTAKTAVAKKAIKKASKKK